MRVRFAKRARHDLDDIYASIAAERPSAADRIVERLLKKTELLGPHPHLGAAETRFGHDLRVTTSGKYVIYYRIRASHVEIFRILHGYRDHGPLLDEE
jgi:toxin ParE1/3/4